MKKQLLTYITILITLSASAQYEAQWTNTITDNGRVNITSISALGKGSLICGTFQDSIIINDTRLISEGEKDIFLMQTDSIGQIQNMIGFGGKCNDIPTNIINHNDTIIIGGVSLYHESEEGGEIFVRYYDYSYDLKQELLLPFAGEVRLEMLQVTDSTIIIGGSLKGSIIAEDFEINSESGEHSFILVFSDKGKYLTSWQSGGTGRHRLRSISANNDRCVALLSVSAGSFISDTLPETSFDNNGILMLSMDNNLNTLWLVSAECAGFSEAVDMATTDNGTLLGFNFNGSLTVNDSTFVSSGTLSSYIAKYDNDGKICWQTTVGGSYCRLSDIVAADSLAIFTGYYRGMMEINNDTISQASVRKAFLISLDNKGDLVWNIDIESDNNSFGNSVTYDGKGVTLCTSILQNKSRSNNGIAKATDISKRNTVSRFIVTDELEEPDTDESNNRNDTKPENGINDDNNDLLAIDSFSIGVFPNPTNNIVNWSVSNGTMTTVEVYDIRGSRIKTHKYEQQASGQIDFSKFSTGVYVLRFLSDKGIYNYEIVKN